jgi:hypothetical protein
MESLINIPDDVWKYQVCQYLTIDDIVSLDNACCNHEYRIKLLKMTEDIILYGDLMFSLMASTLRWLALRRIYLVCMKLDDDAYPWNIDGTTVGCSYGEIFKHVQNIRFDCESVLDASVISVLRHCIKLQMIDLSYCDKITDASISALIEYCPDLQVLELSYCDNVSAECVLPLSKRCAVVRFEVNEEDDDNDDDDYDDDDDDDDEMVEEEEEEVNAEYEVVSLIEYIINHNHNYTAGNVNYSNHHEDTINVVNEIQAHSSHDDYDGDNYDFLDYFLDIFP